MNALLICGSRNVNGQTATAASAVVKGLQAAGAAVEQVFLPTMNLAHCRQCEDSGWGLCRREGRCTIQDDFAALYEKIKQSDGVIFATPVYFADLSESLKAYADRLRRVARHDNGNVALKDKPAMGICVAGGRGGGAPQCCVIMERLLTTCEFDVVNMIPARRQNLQSKLPAMEQAGQWFATKPSSK